VEDYVAHCLLRGRARIDFRRLAPQPRLELQYALQCRHDQQTITAPPPVVNWAIGQVSAAGVGSLLDHSREQWRALTAGKSGGWYQGFVLHAHDVVTTLREGTGWEVEYPRDVWRLHTLPGLTRNTGKAPEGRNHLRFDRIIQPWLRELAKRWARLRLSGGLTVSTVLNDMGALTRFSTFLGQAAPSSPRWPGSTGRCWSGWPGWPPSRSGSAPRRTRSPACTCSSPRSASTAGTTPCLPPRCSSPATPRAGPRGARVGSPNT
jgi:hypothetical protein